MIRHHGHRYTSATLAFVLALAPTARTTEDEWLHLLEAIEEATHPIVYS